MFQIRLGLEKNKNISCYLNPSIDWKEMEDIRLKLK